MLVKGFRSLPYILGIRSLDTVRVLHIIVRGRGPDPPEFAKLNIADITGNEKTNYFSYLRTSTVIREVWTPPGKNFLDPRLSVVCKVRFFELGRT